MTAIDEAAIIRGLARRATFRNYRRLRQHFNPFTAAREERDGAARFLADSVIAGEVSGHAVESYRVAVAIYEAVVSRGAIDGTVPFSARTLVQRFWAGDGKRPAAVSS